MTKSAVFVAPAIAVASLSCTGASEPDYRAYFAHPDAQIMIRIGTASSAAIPFKNHSIPKASNEEPGFQNGFGTTGDRPDSPNVHWQFIRKTEFGDVYLVDIKKRGALITVFPVLYAGSPMIAYDQDGIRVSIDPSHSEAE